MSKNSPITKDKRWFKDEGKSIQFDITDANDNPIDVSSYALRWVLEARSDPTDVLSKVFTGDDISVGDGEGTNDRVTVTIKVADTTALAANTYRHSLWRTDADNEQLLAEGNAVLQDSAKGD